MKTISLVLSLFGFLFFSLSTEAQVNWQDFNDIKSMLSTQRGGDKGGDAGGVGQTTNSGSGGGESALKLAINLDWADSGNMLAKECYLNWQEFNGVDAGPYKVVVEEMVADGNEKIVLVDHTREHYMKIPLDKMDLKEGTDYRIKVISSTRKLTSKAAKFRIVSNDVYSEAIHSAKVQDEFSSATRLEKIMMKAWALQSVGLNYEAYKKYKMYVENDKDNAKLRNMRDMFRKHVKISCLCK